MSEVDHCNSALYRIEHRPGRPIPCFETNEHYRMAFQWSSRVFLKILGNERRAEDNSRKFVPNVRS